MDYFLWLLSIPMIGFSVLVIAFNFYVFYRKVVKKERAPSAAPFAGCIMCCLGLHLMPIDLAWYFILLPLFVDYGGIVGVAFMYYQKENR